MKKKDLKQTNATMDEIIQIANSVKEDVNDSESITEAWGKIEKFFFDMDRVRIKLPMAGAKSGITEDLLGHTRFLQGVNLPIVVNSIVDEFNNWETSECGMRIGKIDGEDKVIITPDRISLP